MWDPQELGQRFLPVRLDTANMVQVPDMSEGDKHVGRAAFRRLIRWGIFAVLLGVTPLGLSAVFRATSELGWSFWALFERGELLIICTGLAGAAAGELFGGRSKFETAETLSGGLAVLLAAVGVSPFSGGVERP